MISLDRFRTPRFVWVNSAIAATLLHTVLVWWGLAAWQTRQTLTSPAPIRIVAVPENTIPAPAAIASSPDVSVAAADSPETATTPGTPAATVTTPPVAPNNPSAAVPLTTPSEAIPPASTPPVVPTDTSPPPTNTSTPPADTPTPLTDIPTPPTNTPTPPTNSPTPPTDTPTPPTDNPVPPTDAPTPPADTPTDPESAGSIQSWWSLRPLPGGGSDIHEEIPRLPDGWQTSTSALLANAGCSSGLVAPGASVRLTLWPLVQADGQISEFAPWDEGNSGVPEAVMQCIRGLRSQMLPLIPAQDGGMAIASDEVLLVIEVRGTP
ncbi:MAG: hypothetical protein AAF892_01970 [Cyanobacteria bacterium P01_D01_bin.71]